MKDFEFRLDVWEVLQEQSTDEDFRRAQLGKFVGWGRARDDAKQALGQVLKAGGWGPIPRMVYVI